MQKALGVSVVKLDWMIVRYKIVKRVK